MNARANNRRKGSAFIALFVAFIGAAVAVGIAAKQPKAATPAADVLSIGGSVTEIVYALDQGHRLVARDTTSTYPKAATALPDVGYMRALSAEGVLSVAPALIVSEAGAGPPEAIAALRAASIPFITIPDAHDAAGVIDKVLAVGTALGVSDKANRLAADIDAQFAKVAHQLDTGPEPLKVMFILSVQGGRILASGRDTAADGIIALAGGVNALQGFSGYKPVTDEAVVAAAPDMILMMDRSGDHAIDNAKLFAMPALVATPAAQKAAVIRMNGLYLLGFGPRTAQAVRDLNEALYGG